MSGKLGFFTFLLIGGIALFVHFHESGQAPAMTDRGMLARQGDYQAALEQSRQTGKPVVLDFYADWCGPCRWMQANTWNDPRVARAMQDFVLMPVNVDGNHELARLFSVSSIPHVIVISPEGKIIRSQIGAMPPDHLLSWLPEVPHKSAGSL